MTSADPHLPPSPSPQSAREKPLRLLVVLPNWLGDAVMATPTLRVIRAALPGTFIGGLVRPGVDQALAGLDVFDEFHIERASGVMGPKFLAAKLRPRRYDTVLLLPNSFSSALTVRIAGINRRLGYARDKRGLLLTRSIAPPTRLDGDWAITPAVDYYYTLAIELLIGPEAGGALETVQSAQTEYDRRPEVPGQRRLPAGRFLELAVTDADRTAAEHTLGSANFSFATLPPFVILNPGGNKPEKRWPTDRFAALARHLAQHHGLAILLNGSPGELDVTDLIATTISAGLADSPTTAPRPLVLNLPRLGITIGALKALTQRAKLMVTNDTGPRHIAAALGTPLVSLFGPTDHRWTLIPCRPGAEEHIITADPTLPADQSANDHPDRCRIDRIDIERVIEACDAALSLSEARP
jgi:heptosyltransferase II